MEKGRQDRHIKKSPAAPPAKDPAAPPALMFIIQAQGFIADLQSADWQEIAEAPDARLAQAQRILYADFQADPDQALYQLAFADTKHLLTASSRYMALLARHFVLQLSLAPECEFLRDKINLTLSADAARDLIEQAPFMVGLEHVNAIWLGRIWHRLSSAYASEIAGFAGTVAEYLTSRHASVHPAGRVFFHLVESKNTSQPFAFLATYSAGLDDTGHVRHLPLKNALLEYKGNQQKLLGLLSTVHRAAESSSFIRELLQTGEIFQPISLTTDEAYVFLREIPHYEEAGIICRMPDWWKKRSSTARVSISIGSRTPSRVGLDALLDCQVALNLGDLQLTAEDLRKLLAETEGLVLIKGKWVEVDHDRLKAVLQAYEQTRKQYGSGISLLVAMRLQLHADSDPAGIEPSAGVEISHGQWLQDLLRQLSADGFSTDDERAGWRHPDAGELFKATLRPYQEKGLAWLHLMKQLRLGACLADDMGLGKTVQILALLNAARSNRAAVVGQDLAASSSTPRENTLLVVPASLIGNWKAEIERFAPDLRFSILHPSEQQRNGASHEADLDQSDLLLTTYGMLDRYEWLRDRHWDTLILDEAQAIKNPSTLQTKAMKKISADWRVALTGTPIENRLSELWSLMDFLNQGLLGSARSFSQFATRTSERPEEYARLKSVLSPFILRRLKTDRSVISDLPDKIEMKTYTSLEKKQTILYRQFVDQLESKLKATADGIERKGLVLASILKLKQICNHPDQFLGQAQYQAAESGKYTRLREICETIYEKRERVLVFTQFKEMTEPLQRFLSGVFAHEGLVLHGGTPVGKRREIVAAFQDESYIPFMVLSIKAGGVGLNLTAANHVIHFDRWWNPAVENQATDRAFRIGQQKHVVVHKFITTGTIEEKIDKMIEDKVSLARDILPDQQEAWITEMNNDQLLDLFRLSV